MTLKEELIELRKELSRIDQGIGDVIERLSRDAGEIEYTDLDRADAEFEAAGLCVRSRNVLSRLGLLRRGVAGAVAALSKMKHSDLTRIKNCGPAVANRIRMFVRENGSRMADDSPKKFLSDIGFYNKGRRYLTRMENIHAAAGILTVEDLESRTYDELCRLKGMGETTEWELKQALDRHGIVLRSVRDREVNPCG